METVIIIVILIAIIALIKGLINNDSLAYIILAFIFSITVIIVFWQRHESMNALDKVVISFFIFLWGPICIFAYIIVRQNGWAYLGFFETIGHIFAVIIGFPGAILGFLVNGIFGIRSWIWGKQAQREKEAERQRQETIETARRARYESKRDAIYAKYYHSKLTGEIIKTISEPCPQCLPSEIRVYSWGVFSYYNNVQVAEYSFSTYNVARLEDYHEYRYNGKIHYANPDEDISINYPLLLAKAINSRMGNRYNVRPIIIWDHEYKKYECDDEYYTADYGTQEYVKLGLPVERKKERHF